jgi:hypothetical protein
MANKPKVVKKNGTKTQKKGFRDFQPTTVSPGVPGSDVINTIMSYIPDAYQVSDWIQGQFGRERVHGHYAHFVTPKPKNKTTNKKSK